VPHSARTRLIAVARRRATWLVPVVFLLLVGNVFWFISDAQRLGGGTLNGYVRDGRYFLANHGSYTEVDGGTWAWHGLHEMTILLGYPVAVLIAYAVARRGGWQWLVGGPPASDAEQRMDAIQQSGRPFLEAAPPIRLSSVDIPAGGATLTFHPAGVIVKLADVEGAAMLRTDVVRLDEHPEAAAPRIDIDHIAPGIASPLIVFTEGDSELADAIRNTLMERGPGATKGR
jgi:hypothetical protein